MEMKELTQDKVEHAVLWSLARQSYDGEFVDAATVRSKLGHAASSQRISAALNDLCSAGLIRDCSAPDQQNYEITGKGIAFTDKLIPQLSSFVGRLNSRGVGWLNSPEARFANIQAKIERAETQPQSNWTGGLPTITIHNSPSISNVNSNSNVGPLLAENAEGIQVARSSARAGWANVIVAIVIGIIVVLVTLKAAGKI